MKIFDYEEVKMNWDSFTYPIAVGTPVSIDGVLADNASAHGLIARTVFAKPDADETLKVMTGGIIDMEEIVAGYGQELSSAAVQALCGIHFYKNGVCIPSGGNGSSDDQKWHETTVTPLFSETVTTVGPSGVYGASLTYSSSIDSDVLTVTLDGVEYTCPKNHDIDGNSYGATLDESTGTMDFTDFPFQVNSYVEAGDAVNTLTTETAGEHTLVAVAENTTYTPAFVEGVKKNSAFIVHFSLNNGGITADKTASEIAEAYNKGFSIIGMFANPDGYNEVYYLQTIYIETGEVSFVNFAVALNGTVASALIKWIRSDPEDANTFTSGDKSLG